MVAENVIQNLSEQRKNETRLWLSLLDLHGKIYPELNRKLRERATISVAKFDVLVQLERFSKGLCMGDLSAKLKVTNGNVSGLVNRLCKDGLVEKTMSAEDRRSFVAILTPEGRERLELAKAVHSDVLSSCFLNVAEQDVVAATAMLTSITQKLAAQAYGQ